jgi:hypothetical protein
VQKESIQRASQIKKEANKDNNLKIIFCGATV